jgi:hypothetical protein
MPRHEHRPSPRNSGGAFNAGRTTSQTRSCWQHSGTHPTHGCMGPQTSRTPLVCSPHSVTQDLHVIHLFTSNLTSLNLHISCLDTNGCGSVRSSITRWNNVHFLGLSTFSRDDHKENYVHWAGKKGGSTEGCKSNRGQGVISQTAKTVTPCFGFYAVQNETTFTL